jgi:hypothetical protein
LILAQDFSKTMQVKKREFNWAAKGFGAGFVLCYLLIGLLQPRQAATPADTAATPPFALPPVPSSEPPTAPAQELRIELLPRVPDVPEPLPPRLRWPGYSLDLIDTSYRPPTDLEKR